MKLSIWQQFSSNHSADYMIVGVFQNQDDATRIGQEIRDLVVSIREWRQNNPQEIGLSPQEQEAEQRYNIEWLEPVDWLTYNEHLREPYKRTPDQRVIIQDMLIFVESPPASHTWQTGHQFANILEVTGADVFHAVYMGNPPNTNGYRHAGIGFDLVINSLDETTQQEILSILKTYEEDAKYSPMPWASYHDRAESFRAHLKLAEYNALEAIWIQDQTAVDAYVQKHREQHQTYVPFDDKDWERMKAFRHQDEQTEDFIRMFRWHAGVHIKEIMHLETEIKVVCDGVRALPMLIRWLQGLNCDVSYTLKQEYDEISNV